jgi:hypothetical protein
MRTVVRAKANYRLVASGNLPSFMASEASLPIHEISPPAPDCTEINLVLILTPSALQAGRSRVRFPMVSLEFFIDIMLTAALWPWG